MTCTIIALVITCTGTPIKTTPAEAITQLQPSPMIAPRASIRYPTAAVMIAESNPTDGPFGPLTLTRPFTRLDGTSYFDPPWIHVGYASDRFDRRERRPDRRRR